MNFQQAKYAMKTTKTKTKKTVYQDRRWVLFSRRYRKKHIFCELCQRLYREPLYTPTHSVHHLVKASKDMSKFLDINNVIALCCMCHRLAHSRRNTISEVMVNKELKKVLDERISKILSNFTLK